METVSTDIDVFIGNKTHVDKCAFDLWLKHVEAKDASKVLGSELDKDSDHLLAYTLDQFRIFCMLEPMLQHPEKLFEQHLFQITPDSKKKLVFKYYEIEETIVREIVGKKLSKGTRRDLDDVSAKTLKPLKVCQRQFDNCRRIFKLVEDASYDIPQEIEKKFRLSKDLCRRYAAIVFLASNRFECNKRKLSHLDLTDFVQCYHFFTENWTTKQGDRVGAEINAEFFHDLRSIKTLSNEVNKIFRCYTNLVSKEPEEISRRLNGNESTVKLLMKNIVSIASNMYKPKSTRDFFVDTIEKVCEIGKSLGWRVDHLKKFFDLFQLAILNGRQTHPSVATWSKFIATFTKCALQLYRF